MSEILGRTQLNRFPSRRDFLWKYGGGLGGIALASLLQQEGLLGDSVIQSGIDAPRVGSQPSRQAGLHHTPKAKRVVQLYMSGGASQCDTFDYKPLLAKDDGKPWDPGGKVELFQSQPGHTMQAPWKWRQYGQCAKWINDCVAPLGQCVDDIAFIHNMVSKSNVHGPATFMQATGFILPGFPSMGAWLSYGMGSEADDLPTFVVLPDPRGLPPNGPTNWGSGFLPAEHQGTAIRPNATNPIADLFAPSGSYVTPHGDVDTLAALEAINRQHQSQRAGDSRLEARIRSYELAARMQVSAPEVLDPLWRARAHSQNVWCRVTRHWQRSGSTHR